MTPAAKERARAWLASQVTTGHVIRVLSANDPVIVDSLAALLDEVAAEALEEAADVIGPMLRSSAAARRSK